MGTKTRTIANNVTTTLGNGRVIQVVESIQNLGNALSSGSHGTWIDSGLTEVSITPTSTSSKILIGFYGMRGHVNGGATNNGAFHSIFRAVNAGAYVNIGQATYGMQSTADATANSKDIPYDLVHIDEPSTTGVCKYKAYYKAYGGSGQYYFHHVGFSGSTDCPILKIAMEIAG